MLAKYREASVKTSYNQLYAHIIILENRYLEARYKSINSNYK